MDLSAKALFCNLNYQMLQLHTARRCHVQEKHIPEITILHIQKEHYNHCLSPQTAPLYSPHTAMPMSNLSLNFRAIYSYLHITIFTILKNPMSFDLYPASNSKKKQCILKGQKLLLPFYKSTSTMLATGQPEQRSSHLLSPLL